MQPKCTAKSKRTGQPCNNRAMTGLTVCRMHGGAAKQARAAGLARVQQEKLQSHVERALVRLGEPAVSKDVDPVDEMLALIARKRAEVMWLREKVLGLENDEELFWGVSKHVEGVGAQGPVDEKTFEARKNIIYATFHEAEDQLARYTATAIRAGIEERQVRVTEQLADRIIGVLTTVRAALDLTSDQVILWDTAVERALTDATRAGAA